ncbi:uncharacterized, partial [Tachysurus ichikawai]
TLASSPALTHSLSVKPPISPSRFQPTDICTKPIPASREQQAAQPWIHYFYSMDRALSTASPDTNTP